MKKYILEGGSGTEKLNYDKTRWKIDKKTQNFISFYYIGSYFGSNLQYAFELCEKLRKLGYVPHFAMLWKVNKMIFEKKL